MITLSQLRWRSGELCLRQLGPLDWTTLFVRVSGRARKVYTAQGGTCKSQERPRECQDRWRGGNVEVEEARRGVLAGRAPRRGTDGPGDATPPSALPHPGILLLLLTNLTWDPSLGSYLTYLTCVPSLATHPSPFPTSPGPLPHLSSSPSLTKFPPYHGCFTPQQGTLPLYSSSESLPSTLLNRYSTHSSFSVLSHSTPLLSSSPYSSF